MLQQSRDEERQVLAFVVGRHDDERVERCVRRRHASRRSKRSEEICSDTSPTRKMMTLSRMSSTDEFVTWDWVRIVQTAYALPSANDARLSGRKTRIGLKIVMTFSRITKNCPPSGPRRIFERPSRTPASIGSNHTL